MLSRLLSAALTMLLLAACQTAGVYVSDVQYNCERIRGYESGTPAYRNCIYDESLSRRYRHP